MSAPVERPLTARQELLAEAFIEQKLQGGEITDAIAQDLGYSGKAAAARAMQAPNVRAHLSSYLDGAGATLHASAQVVAEAHAAMDTKFFSYEGKVCDEREIVDHNTRLRAAELNLEARGELKQGVSLTFNKFGDLSDEQLAKIALGQEPVDKFLPGGAT